MIETHHVLAYISLPCQWVTMQHAHLERGQDAIAGHIVSSVRSSNSHPDLLVTHPPPLFQITPVLNTGLSLSEPLQLYKGYNAI